MLVRKALEQDIDSMVSLSYEKRREYEKAQPQFWKYAEGAEKIQASWFKELLTNDQYIMLVTDDISAFLIGRIIPAPEVYDPGGLTLMIDDFCVKTPDLWKNHGRELIEQAKKLGKPKGVSQILVVCGHLDMPKREFLNSINLSIASEWYVGNLME